MIIKWIGHSCFQISEKCYSIVIDPFHPDMVPGFKPYTLEANEVLCTHEHGDHNYREAVNIIDSKIENPFKISFIKTYHDMEKGNLRGEIKGYILETNNYRIAHLGDIGCNLEDYQIQKLKRIDFLLIPVGGYYTINALQAKEIVDQINPKTVIPMHYRGDGFGFDVLARADEFLHFFRSEDIKYLHTNEINLENTKPKKILVFQLK